MGRTISLDREPTPDLTTRGQAAIFMFKVLLGQQAMSSESDYKHHKSTDKSHIVKVKSKLSHVRWLIDGAQVGSQVGFEIKTVAVGNRAPITVTVKDQQGKVIENIKGSVVQDSYHGSFSVPEDLAVGTRIYLDVSLPDNDCEGESDLIPVLHEIQVSNMRWSLQKTRLGEKVNISADVLGCPDGTRAIIGIWEYDPNGAHDSAFDLAAKVKKAAISVDWRFKYHAPTDNIPSQAELQKYGKSYEAPKYFFTLEIAGKKCGIKQDSGFLTFTDWISFSLQGYQNGRMGDQSYSLTLPDGSQRNGKLDGKGFARVEDIPPGPCSLEFPELEEYGVLSEKKGDSLPR